MSRYATVLIAIVLLLTLPSLAQERDRSKVPDKYKWDLTHLYPSDAAWQQAKEKLAAEIPQVAPYKGKLGESPARFADALELGSRLSKELNRLSVYASTMSDTDTRVSKYQGMQQEITQLGSRLGAEAAFAEPEILKLGRDTIDRFIAITVTTTT